MPMTQGERLALFSRQVRESSLKRLRQVKPEDRSWRPAQGRLSFVDHLKHLVDCDHWILAVAKGQDEPCADIKPGEGDPERWDDYLRELVELGRVKEEFCRGLTDAQLNQGLEKAQELGSPDVGSLILRHNLDHEIHHRGAFNLMLLLKYPES
jgi:uncharacterized damage-inducible protein DinB